MHTKKRGGCHLKKRVDSDVLRMECVELIREARNKGWTLEWLATELDTSPANLSRWDRGINRPHRYNCQKLIPLLKELLK